MIILSSQDAIDKAKIDQNKRILATYGVSEDNFIKSMSGSEFKENYSRDKYEIYSLQALDKYRNDIQKAEGIEDKDAYFKQSIKDLKPVLVYENGVRSLYCVKAK